MYRMMIRGMISGVVATAVLSLLMLSRKWIPQLNTVVVLDEIARVIFSKYNAPIPLAGWMWHLVIGTIWWGGLFGIMEPILPGRVVWLKGLLFGAGVGLYVIWAVLPIAAGGVFGAGVGLIQPVVTFTEHLIYGFVLGLIYGRLKVIN